MIQDLLRPEHNQAIERHIQAIKQHQAAAHKADKLLPELQTDQRVAIQDPISKKWSKSCVFVEKKRNRSWPDRKRHLEDLQVPEAFTDADAQWKTWC